MKHPGLELAQKIKASGFRQANIAEQLQVSPTSLNEMLKGKRLFPAAVCVRMQEIFGYGRELWRKQAEYEWWLAFNDPTPAQPAHSGQPRAAAGGAEATRGTEL